MLSSPRETPWKQTMQNIVTLPSNTELKFADLSGNQLVINIKRLIGLKIIFGEIHKSQGLDWAFPSLFHCSLL